MPCPHPAIKGHVFLVSWAPSTAIAFTRNYSDHSNDTGYQFELHCDKCGNGYRSSFQVSALSIGSRIAKGLGSLLGGNKLWSAGNAADHLKDGLRGPAWDSAFQNLGLPRSLLERLPRPL